jgi:hypothetical protein
MKTVNLVSMVMSAVITLLILVVFADEVDLVVKIKNVAIKVKEVVKEKVIEMKSIDLFNSINIFTDASTTKVNYRKDSTETVSAGYVVVFRNVIERYGNRIIAKSHSEYGELYAILMGLKAVYKEIADRNLPISYPINVFTDCLNIVRAIRHNSKKWYVTDDNIIRSRSNNDRPVFNQDLFKMIIKMVAEYNIPINFYHIKAHASLSFSGKNILEKNRSELYRVRNQFYHENRVFVPITDIMELCYYNIFIDKLTRNNMKEILKSNLYYKNIKNYIKPNLYCNITSNELYSFNNLVGM